MAYNNAYPINYPQSYPQFYPQYTQIQPNQSQQSQQNNGMIWVQGIAGAKSYLVAPNSTVQLWDSERNSIYIKSADASGMPSMKILDYKEREQSQSSEPAEPQTYVTHDELKDFEDRITQKISDFKEKLGA